MSISAALACSAPPATKWQADPPSPDRGSMCESGGRMSSSDSQTNRSSITGDDSCRNSPTRASRIRCRPTSCTGRSRTASCNSSATASRSGNPATVSTISWRSLDGVDATAWSNRSNSSRSRGGGSGNVGDSTCMPGFGSSPATRILNSGTSFGVGSKTFKRPSVDHLRVMSRPLGLAYEHTRAAGAAGKADIERLAQIECQGVTAAWNWSGCRAVTCPPGGTYPPGRPRRGSDLGGEQVA
jgi:hypothetical protein